MIKLIGKIRSLSILPSKAKNHRPLNYRNQTLEMIETSNIDEIAAALDRLESAECFETPEPFLARIIRSYGVAGRFGDAIGVFSRIPKFRCVPSHRSLDSLLRVLCERDDEALRLVPDVLIKSRSMGIRLEESSFRILIGALCRIGGVGQAVEILKCMISDGYYLDGKICSSILLALCDRKDNLSLDGSRVFCFLRELRRLGFRPSSIDYKKVIDVLVNARKISDALKVLEYLKNDGIKPEIIIYNTILNGIVEEEGNFEEADKLFDEMLVLGLIPNIHTYNAYILGLCKQNHIEKALFTITAMEELDCKPNATTYNLVVSKMIENGTFVRAKKLVSKMGSKGIRANSETRMILLKGILGKGDVNGACQLMERMLSGNSCSHCSAFDELVSELCRSGKVGKGLEIVEKMGRENVGPGAKAWESLLLRLGFEISFSKEVLTSLLNSDET